MSSMSVGRDPAANVAPCLLQWLYREAVRRVAKDLVPGSQQSFLRQYLESRIWPFLRRAVCVPRDLPCVAEALHQLPEWPPTTILVTAGTYHGSFQVEKPVTILGLGEVVLTCKTGHCLRLAAESGPPPELLGLTFTSSSTCVLVERGKPVFRSCIVSSSAGHGLLVAGDAKPTITDCEFHGHRHRKAAIACRDSAAGVVRRCCFKDNLGHGIVASGTSSLLVSESYFLRHARAAIVARGEAMPQIQDNRFEGNLDYGILACEDAQPRVERNHMSGQRLPAIAFRDRAAGTLRHNSLSKCEAYGIMVCGSSRPLIESNYVCGLTMPGIAVRDDSQPVVRGNQFEGNTGVVIAVNDDARPVVEGNTLKNNKRKAPDALGKSGSAGNDVPDADTGETGGDQRRMVDRASIAVRDRAAGVVRRNRLERNSGHGILLCGLARPVVEHNEICAQEAAAIAIQDGSEATVRWNVLQGGGCSILLCGAAQPVIDSNTTIHGGEAMVVRGEFAAAGPEGQVRRLRLLHGS